MGGSEYDDRDRGGDVRADDRGRGPLYGGGQNGAPEVCFDFTRGRCTRGESCRFSHDNGMTAGKGGNCYECGDPGHFGRDCPVRLARQNGNGAPPENQRPFGGANADVSGKRSASILCRGTAVMVTCGTVLRARALGGVALRASAYVLPASSTDCRSSSSPVHTHRPSDVGHTKVHQICSDLRTLGT